MNSREHDAELKQQFDIGYRQGQIEALEWCVKIARFAGSAAILTNLHTAMARLKRGGSLEGTDE